MIYVKYKKLYRTICSFVMNRYFFLKNINKNKKKYIYIYIYTFFIILSMYKLLMNSGYLKLNTLHFNFY